MNSGRRILFDATSSVKISCGGISSGEISLVGTSSAATSFVANLKDHRVNRTRRLMRLGSISVCRRTTQQSRWWSALSLRIPLQVADEFEYHLRFLTRFPLGTRNPDILDSVEEMLNQRPLKGRTRLVIDSTGIGMPIVNDFFARRLRPFPILITGAARTSFKRRTLCVPKRDLVANLTRLFERRLLKIPADIQLREVLVQELTNFTMRITKNAHDTYSPLHHSQHDDLVIALALACYYLEWLRRKPRINLRITGISRTVYP